MPNPAPLNRPILERDVAGIGSVPANVYRTINATVGLFQRPGGYPLVAAW